MKKEQSLFAFQYTKKSLHVDMNTGIRSGAESCIRNFEWKLEKEDNVQIDKLTRKRKTEQERST